MAAGPRLERQEMQTGDSAGRADGTGKAGEKEHRPRGCFWGWSWLPELPFSLLCVLFFLLSRGLSPELPFPGWTEVNQPLGAEFPMDYHKIKGGTVNL